MKRYYLAIITFYLATDNYAFNMDFMTSHLQNDSIPLKQISFEEANTMLKEKRGILNLEFTKPSLSEVFNLSDGSVLVFGKKACFIYDSEEDVRKLMKLGPRKISILYNLNYYGEKLPFMIEDANIKLSNVLRIPLTKLDFTERSLDEIDTVLIDMQTTGQISKEELKKNIVYFIIYSGEVFINTYKGNWNMVLDSDQQTWLPYILDQNNKRIDLFAWVYDSLCNTEDDEIPTITSGYYSKVKSFFNK